MKRLFRDKWDRKIAGVCGGLGLYLKVDPTIVRMLFVAMSFLSLGLPMLVAYLLLWILLPEGPNVYIDPGCKKLKRSRKSRYFAGVLGGLGEFFGIDPIFFRIAFLFLIIPTVGLIILYYIICFFIIPEK